MDFVEDLGIAVETQQLTGTARNIELILPHDSPKTPELRLLAAMMKQAIEDLSNPVSRIREKAWEWVMDDPETPQDYGAPASAQHGWGIVFEDVAELFGLDVSAAREYIDSHFHRRADYLYCFSAMDDIIPLVKLGMPMIVIQHHTGIGWQRLCYWVRARGLYAQWRVARLRWSRLPNGSWRLRTYVDGVPPSAVRALVAVGLCAELTGDGALQSGGVLFNLRSSECLDIRTLRPDRGELVSLPHRWCVLYFPSVSGSNAIVGRRCGLGESWDTPLVWKMGAEEDAQWCDPETIALDEHLGDAIMGK